MTRKKKNAQKSKSEKQEEKSWLLEAKYVPKIV